MSNTKQTEKYSNLKDMPIRTRVALFFILIAIKLCEPWEYSHQFESDLKHLQQLLLGKEIKE